MAAVEPPAASPLRLVSKNVGGLHSSADKRRTLFDQLLRRRSVEVFLLQETHSRDDAEVRRWATEAASGAWRGQQFWHHGSSASCGVAILLRDSAHVSGAHIGYQDAHGRILRVDFKYAGLDMAVVNVYAPHRPEERAAFFSQELPKATLGGGLALLAGDFNCILRHEDKWGPFDSIQRFAGRNQLEAFMVMEQLEDSWLLSPRANRPTFHTQAAGADGRLCYTAARLDRWLTPVALRDWVQETVIHPCRGDYLPGDHGAVVLHLQPPRQPPRGPGVWSCPLSILNDEAYLSGVQGHIAAFCQRHAALGPRDLWEGVKLAIADFTQAYCFGEARRKRLPERMLRHTAERALAFCQAHPDSCAAAAAQLRDASARLAKLHEERAATSKQAEDVLWQDYGEQGSYWFHRMGRAATPLEQIVSVATADGTRRSFASDDPTERAAAAERLASFYEGLFTPVITDAAAQDTILAATPQRLSPEACKDAEGPDGLPALTPACFKAALAAAPRGKRPGSDGLPYEFYSALQATVAPLLLAAFREAFEDTGAATPLAASQRLGLITLIYKGGGKSRDSCDSYRPITLLNCDYKLVARIIATRMGSPVNDVLSVTQTAFVPGRDIADNVLFHLEEIDWLEAEPPIPLSPRQGCVVFLDFEKAYDRANRAWLMRCLQHFGFGAGLQRWVEVLLAGTRAQVLYNGHRTRQLAVTSGMAQGSPLSPLLYNVQAQPLAAYLQHLQAAGALRPIRLPDGPPAPPSQQHADDTSLHLHSLEDLPPALQAIALYGAASGARLNVNKTQGILLGSHPDVPSVDGIDAATGVRFLRPGEHLRHLGVLLARPRDQPAAAHAMHAQRLASLRAVARHWAPFGLSFLGRLHVAKQCMASILYYHAQFVRPAPSQLQEAVTIISAFIARPAGPADDPRAFMGHPKLAASSLPKEDGGLAVVDVRSQLDALQAKIIAKLVHPRRHPWKPLMAAAISAAAPPHLGVALAVFTAATLPARAERRSGRPALLPRHADYLHALRRMAPHRAVAASEMGFHHILLEPVMHNASIRFFSGGPILSPTNAPPQLVAALSRHGICRLRDLRQALLAQPAHPELSLLLPFLPLSWLAAVTQQVAPTPEAYSSADGTLVASSLLFGSATCSVWPVLGDGRLSRLPLQPAPAPASLAARTWHPCHVISVPRSVDLMTLAEREEVKERRRRGEPQENIIVAYERYFVGTWASISIAPGAWAVGTGHPLTTFSVHLAALRYRRLRAVTAVPGFALGKAIFPKAWAASGGGGGLSVVEARWVAALEERSAPPVAVDASGAGPSDPAAALAARSRRQFAAGWQPAVWMRSTFRFNADDGRVAVDPDDAADGDVPPVPPPSQPEEGIGRRVRARRTLAGQPAPASPTGQAPSPAPPLPPPDHHDLAAPPQGAGGGVARPAWFRLLDRSLPREARALAWRLLHASLYSGVFWAYVTQRSAAHACCKSPACGEATFETSQHLFLTCPDVAPAADWLVRLWAAVAGPGATPPPCSVEVLLADDHRVWQPAGGEVLVQLWTALRLSWLSAVWSMRCRRLADPERSSVTPAGIVTATVASITRLIRRDFARTVGDARTLTASPSDWFRGTATPGLSREEFLKRWGVNGVLCSLTAVNAAGQGGHLIIHLAPSHPVSLHVPP
jgi:hypothetical protein